MEQAVTAPTAQGYAFDLARWYHEVAKLCIQASEVHMALTEDSTLEEVQRAFSLNEVVRIRMSTLQSVERVFRSEFFRMYVDHQVEQILS